MVLYLARLGIGHSVINLMDQIGIFVSCGGWRYPDHSGDKLCDIRGELGACL